MENTTAPVAPQGVGAQTAEQPTNAVPGAAPGETVAETMARMYKVKVDGQEIEVDENELVNGYSQAKASQKRMQEAAMSRKEAESVLRMFKENPRQAMTRLGIDVRQLAESVIQDELSEAMLSPEQKELRQYKRQLEEYQSQEKSAKEQYEKQQQEQEMARYTEQIQSEIVSTLDTAGLPKTERTVGRIAYYMQSAISAGYPNVTPADVIEYVKNDYVADFKSFLGGMSEDQIEMFLGSDVLRKAAKATVKTGMTTKVVPKDVNANRPKQKEGNKPTSPREYFKRW